MLEVTLYRDQRNHLSGLSARGHTDFAEHGEDIVCAAVSAILQAARLGLEAYAGEGLDSRQKPGELGIDLDEGARAHESVQAILVTAELAVEHIARRYPDHVRLQHERAGGTVGSETSGG
jgi:hypothetical protein